MSPKTLFSTENVALWQSLEGLLFVSKAVGTTAEVQVDECELNQSDWPRGIGYVVSYRWITGIVGSNATQVTDCVRVPSALGLSSVRRTFQRVSPTSSWLQILFEGVGP